MEERIKEERERIIAMLAVDAMETELMKDKSEHTLGHIHGLRRAIYLINHTENVRNNSDNLNCLICGEKLGLRIYKEINTNFRHD